MFSAEQLEALGAQVVAGRVILKQKFVTGVWTKDGLFEAVDDAELGVIDATATEVRIKPAAKKAAKSSDSLIGEALAAVAEAKE